MSDSWPEGVPATLWNYGLLEPQDIQQIPLMGVQFGSQFIYSFLVGGAFLAYFAWTRFMTRTTQTDTFSFRVLNDIPVAHLGGRGAMLRGYLLYFTALMFVYVAMTFFGKLILQAVNGLNLAGIQVDTASLKFDSPQWPLLLAFGLAGLAPLIPPLRMAEDWLFTRAYRAVGIPVRIKHTTRNLIDILDEHARDGATPLAKDLSSRRREVEKRLEGTWVETALEREGKREQSVALFAELQLLVDWAEGGRGAWPGPEVSDEVRRLEQDLARQASKLVVNVLDRLDEARSRGAGRQVGDARRKRDLDAVLRDARTLRDELLAVLSVYAERDPTYVGQGAMQAKADESEREDRRAPNAKPRCAVRPALRELLGEADQPNLAGAGPEAGLLLCMMPVVLLYLTFSWQGGHPLIAQGATSEDVRAVLATGVYELARVMAVVWLPLLAAFAARQYYHDRGEWILVRKEDPSAWTMQRLVTTGIGTTVAVVALVGVAMLYAFAIAPTVSRFQDLLLRGPQLLLYVPSLAVLTIPIVHYAVKAADIRGHGDGHGRGIWLGIRSALVVMLAQAAHMAFWYEGQTCTEFGVFLLDVFSAGCFQFYGGLDFFVYPTLAFLAAGVFGNPSSITTAQRRSRLLSLRGAHAVAVLALAVMALSSAASAEPVRVGFRKDAEPFVFAVDMNRLGSSTAQADQKYVGFIADLCYSIFRGSEFEIEEVEIDASDRFERLKDPGAEGIDVLCDPVTMRFSEPGRAEVGLFSPIVFASGVTYLQNRGTAQRQTVYIAYVENTTARDVLDRICAVDLFTVVPQAERKNLAVMCATARAARDFDKVRRGQAGPVENEQARADWNSLFGRAHDAIKDEISAAEEGVQAAPEERKAKSAAVVTFWRDAEETLMQVQGDCTSLTTCKEAAGRAEEALGSSCAVLEPVDEAGAARRHSDSPGAVYRFCPIPAHAEAIEWLCKRRYGDNARRTLIYLGDRDIILGKLRSWNSENNAQCLVENERGGDDLTYEPYAIMTSAVRPNAVELARLVQRRVYEFFSFEGRAEGTFNAYFPKDVKMSPLLGYLFLLNGVEDERNFLRPTEVEEEEAPKDGSAEGTVVSSAAMDRQGPEIIRPAARVSQPVPSQ